MAVTENEPTPASASTERTGTVYVILAQQEDGAWVRQEGTITSSNKDAAITDYANGLPVGQRGGTYKAVSESGWSGGRKIVEKDAFDATKIED